MCKEQGALRAHPFLYREVAAAQNPDRRQGIAQFDAAFGGHVSFILRNVVGSFLHGLSNGRFASSPVDHEMSRWYRRLHRMGR